LLKFYVNMKHISGAIYYRNTLILARVCTGYYRYRFLARYVKDCNWDFIDALNGANFWRNTCQSLHDAASKPPMTF